MLCLMMFEKRSCWVFGPAILEPSIGDICCEVTMTKNELSQCILLIYWRSIGNPNMPFMLGLHAILLFWPLHFLQKHTMFLFFPVQHPMLPWAPSASLSTQCFLEHPMLSWAPSASFLLPLNHSWRPYMAQKEHGWVGPMVASRWYDQLVVGLDTAWWHLRPSFFWDTKALLPNSFLIYGYGNLARLARMGRSQWLHHDCCKSHRQPWDASQSRSNKSFGAKPSRLVHTGWKNQNVANITKRVKGQQTPGSKYSYAEKASGAPFDSECFPLFPVQHTMLPWAPSASLSTQCFLEHPVLLFHCKSKELFYIAALQVHRYWHTYIYCFMWFHVHPKKSTNSFSL